MKWPVHNGLPAFWVTGALNEAWALLQKLLSMNYSNLITAALNYNTEAESSEKQQETDREGMAVWGRGKTKKYMDSWGAGG